MNQKGFTSIFLGIAIAFLVGVIGYFGLVKNKTTTPQVSQVVFSSQKECEEKTGTSCSFQMCDDVPPGKTFEEVCGKDFKKGWVASSTTRSAPTPVTPVKGSSADLAFTPDGPYNLVLYDNESEYRDKKYNFILHYPKDWAITTQGREYVRFSSPGVDRPVGGIPDGRAIIDFTLHQSTTIDRLGADFKKAQKNGLIYKLISTKTGIQLGYPGVLTTYTAGSEGLHYYSTYWREYKGAVYEFKMVSSSEPTREQTSALDRIMNTLRFE